MAILSAAIEANGWVLVVTLTGSASAAGDFSGYTLDPNGTPRLVVATTAPGFAVSGGVAVAATTARSLIATKPLRLPVVATPAGVRAAKTPDEANLGGGQIRVRIALSQHVYATDTGLTLTALAGWRTGEAGGTIAVTNGSTLATPSPIVRWSDVPYQRKTGPFDLEVVAFSHHPNGLAAVAGVRFTATDGTNTASGWATALSTSTKYATGGTGVGVRVYKVTIDGSTASPAPLSEGLVRCDFKAFPWIGPARASDTGDTALAAVAASGPPSMTSLTTAGFAAAAQTPFVVAYDPNGTWLPPLYVYIEPNTWIGTGSIASNVLTVASTTSGAVGIGTKISGVGVTPGCTVVAGSGTTWTVTATANVATIALQGGGTSASALVTVSSNPAAASAGVCADSYTVARNAMKAQNRVVPARNGQAASASGATDGMTARYKAGSYTGLGATAVATGITTGFTWEIVEGDPANANPRANVIVAAAASGNPRTSRTLLRNMTLIGPDTISFITSVYAWIDNCEIRGPAGNTTSTTPFLNSTGQLASYWTNLRYWQMLSYLGGNLNRNCEVELGLAGITVLNNRRLPTAVATSTGVAVTAAGTDPFGSSQDRIAAGNDLRYIKGTRSWLPSATPNASAGATALGTAYPVFNRQVFANNVCEQYGPSNPMFTTIGENNTVVATYNIIEGNTVTGDRVNLFYDDLNLTTIAANDTESNIVLGNRIANNAFDQHSIKVDFFNDSVVAGQRIGVALSTTRNKVKAVGDEIVIAGSPANVYRCITAGTTATSGGPTGTGSDITDGTVHWAWFATETRQHGYRPQAVRSWSALYGVGMVDNVVIRGNTDAEFLHEFEGLNTPNYSIDIPAGAFVYDPKYTLDKSGTDVWLGTPGAGRYSAANTGGGDYKPLTGSPLLAHSRAANIDTDIAGVARQIPFATGAVQSVPIAAVSPAGALQASRASSETVGLALALRGTSTLMASRAAASAAGWATTLASAPATMTTRAAASRTGWAASLTPTSATLASRATSSAIGWATTLAGAASTIATRAAAGVAAWTAALRPDATRTGIGTGDGRIDWTALLLAASARSATTAATGAIGVIPPGMLVPDNGRVPVTDRTLPTLLPGGVTPPQRTLIVTGDFRVETIPAD